MNWFKSLDIVVILSIVSSVIAIMDVFFRNSKKYNNKYSLSLRIFIAISLILAAYKGYTNNQLLKPILRKQQMKVELNKKINKIVNKYETSSIFYPGRNEGITNGILIVLEPFKEIIPERYKELKNDVDGLKSKEPGLDASDSIINRYNERRKESAEKMISLIKIMATEKEGEFNE